MRYCGILALPRAVLRYSYPPYAPLNNRRPITLRLKDRFNEHRRPILNPTGNYIHTAVSEHFLTHHSDNHMLLIPIEKLKNGRDSSRKAREAHLIHKATTIEPLGINKCDQL